MPAVARFDLKMNADEKEVVSSAAALSGTTMTSEDFKAFTSAINGPFAPNAALNKALEAAGEIRRA